MSSAGTSQARCSLALFDTHCRTPQLERTFAYSSNTQQLPPEPHIIPPDDDAVSVSSILAQPSRDPDTPPSLVR